jgi:hypothetical protein
MVAAHERRMNRTVFKLITGYLARSRLLYFVIGLLQFLMTEFFWALRYDRMPAAGILLGIWGAVAALNQRSLTWRSLPLNSRDAGLFRWWAIAGVPGIFLTLVTGIAWVSQHSNGLPTPDSAIISEGIVALWAALGVVSALSRRARWSAKARAAKIAAAVGGSMLALPYGLPVGPAARPYSIAFISAGIILLLVSAARASGGMDWRWPDLADRAPQAVHRHASFRLTHFYGLGAILIPLAQRTAIFAAIATVIIVSLQRVFPRASVVLFWAYFICLSTAGFLLTYRIRTALQPLRCLPLSAQQLAALLQLFGALPGLATLGLTLLINRAVLNAGLGIRQVGAFALIIIACQVFPVWQATLAGRSKFLEYWAPLLLRFFWPVYIGGMAVSWSGAYDRIAWISWPLQAGGVILCITGYFVLVQQLRAGIRPSSNEDAFS